MSRSGSVTLQGNARPDAPATERNQQAIYAVLQRYLADDARILEIASGTGQHAVYFCTRQAGWHWQCTDLPDRLPGIEAWLADLRAAGIGAPAAMALDAAGDWPTFSQPFDAVLTANSFHIMPWAVVQSCIAGMAARIARGGLVFVYGPFNYAGRFTSPSNQSFDDSLRSRSALMGLRDAESVEAVFAAQGVKLVADHAMPANNRMLVLQKHAVQ